MDEGNTGVNALIGAVVTIVASGFIPFAPVFGGGLAGYFEGGSRNDGLRVGALSGVIALIPALLIGFLFFGIFGSIMMGGMMGGGGIPIGFGVGGVFFVFLFVGGGIYFLGLSALGGWLGNYVKYDTEFEM